MSITPNDFCVFSPHEKEEVEVWADILGYEGVYQVSIFGRVKSVGRNYTRGCVTGVSKDRFLKPSKNRDGYLVCCLCSNGSKATKKIHQLVAIAFLSHIPNKGFIVVDHISGDKLDNRVENLRIVTHRENISTCFRKYSGGLSSQYAGVSWYKRYKKWRSKIQISGKINYLGYFDNEKDASDAYQFALKQAAWKNNI